MFQLTGERLGWGPLEEANSRPMAKTGYWDSVIWRSHSVGAVYLRYHIQPFCPSFLKPTHLCSLFSRSPLAMYVRTLPLREEALAMEDEDTTLLQPCTWTK